MGSGPVRRLPDDAIVVHIGMHKTGTTAIQSMLAAARSDLAARGISYPGRGEAQHLTAQSLLGSSSQFGKANVAPEHIWSTVAGAAAKNPQRTVLSSEFFSRAGTSEVRKFVSALGPERVHVLVGVRNFAAVALSAWQQTLKTGHVHGLDEWLAENFVRDPAGRLSGGYWQEQHPVRTVRRWAEVLGPERVFVVLIDETDRTLLPSAFDALLGLPAGTLGARAAGKSNRSMTATEAALARAVNGAVRGKLRAPDYRRLIRYGMLRRMVEARPRGADEILSVLPADAAGLATDEGKASVGEIEQTGVHIIGDTINLVALPAGVAHSTGTNAELPLDAAVEAIVGVVAGAVGDSWRLTEPKPSAKPGPAAVDQLSTGELIKIVGARLGSTVRRRGGGLFAHR